MPARELARSEAACKEPTLRPVQDGDRIVAIELTCTCGETTLVELDYEPAVAEEGL